MYSYSEGQAPWYDQRENIQEIVIESGVTSIGQHAFEYCPNLTSVSIPESITRIMKYAFYECKNLITINAHGAQVYKEDLAFCNLSNSLQISNILIESSSEQCGNNLTWALENGTLTISGTGEMYDYGAEGAPWYNKRSDIQSVVIESGVTSVGDEAFDGCTNLTSVELPDTVTSIGAYAFQNTGFTTFTIPASVTSIGKGAFIECSSLTAISVEDGNSSYTAKDGALLTADGETFVCCPAGKSGYYTIPSGVTTISDDAFYGCGSLTSVTIPSGVTSIEYGAFAICTSLTSITIPSSVTSIGEGAFYNCEKLSYITIPSSVTSIGETAFAYCAGLTSISIPSGVTSIGEASFALCENLQGIWVDYSNQNYVSDNGILFTKDKSELICYPAKHSGTSYTVPDGVTSIAANAFQWCESLTSITIPDSVTFIGENVFNYTRVTSITIPASVTTIDDGAFYNCWGLTEILVDADNPNYTSVDGVLFSKDGSELIALPTQYSGAYTIPDGVTSISCKAFACCRKLTSVTIPSSVTYIGEKAFYACDSIKASDVYYDGSEADRANITIEKDNDCIKNDYYSDGIHYTWNYSQSTE